jgi:hypothetical protein
LTEKKRYIPLRIKIVCLILCSTLVAVGVYYVCSSIGYNEIDRTYMSSSASNSRVRVYLAKFQTYVRENNLSSKDLDSIAQWTKEAKYVHLLIFKDNQARAEASYNGASSLTGTKYETYYEAVRGDYSFTPITFSDGIFQVSLECNVTHACFENSTLLKSYPRGKAFLKKTMQLFAPKDTIQWFQEKGVTLIAESDGRMFPTTNTSETIINTFLLIASKLGIQIRTHQEVTLLNRNRVVFY